SQPWSNTSGADWYERAPTGISKQEHCIVKRLRLKRAARGLPNGSIMVTAAMKVNAEPASFGQGEHDIDSPECCPQRVTDSKLAAFVNGVSLRHSDLQSRPGGISCYGIDELCQRFVGSQHPLHCRIGAASRTFAVIMTG